jgi:hypothetical protein
MTPVPPPQVSPHVVHYCVMEEKFERLRLGRAMTSGSGTEFHLMANPLLRARSIRGISLRSAPRLIPPIDSPNIFSSKAVIYFSIDAAVVAERAHSVSSARRHGSFYLLNV